jgi:hypothetical protein
MAITSFSISCLASTLEKERTVALFKPKDLETDMRKQATFAVAALVFALSMIVFAAFNANETTASDTLRVGPQHALPVSLIHFWECGISTPCGRAQTESVSSALCSCAEGRKALNLAPRFHSSTRGAGSWMAW